MTLPITESILRGELRPNLLIETVSTEKQSLLMRQLRYTKDKGTLIELEKDIVTALGNYTRANEAYTEDKNLLNAIKKWQCSSFQSSHTRVYKSVLSDVLACPEISTPTLRLYKTILDLEKERTVRALVELHTTMKDDQFIRPEIKKLLKAIKDYSQEVKAWKGEMYNGIATLLQNMFTELYFSLILTFSTLLYANGALDFDDDFEDFVFQWKEAYPTAGVSQKYKKATEEIKKEKAAIRQESSLETQEEAEEKEKHPLTMAEKFLTGAQQYEFLKIPKIVALDCKDENKRREKALRLAEVMLESPAHTAAMLDYLGFYQWIKDKYETNYSMQKYYQFCTKMVMGKEGEAFKKYHLSLKAESSYSKKYCGWEYIEKVKDEYQAIKNGTPLGKDS